MSSRIGRGADRLESLTGVSLDRSSTRILSSVEPDRTVVEYSSGNGDGFVAKFFTDDAGARSADAMSAVRKALGSRPDATLAVPEVVHFDRAERILFMRRAPGSAYLPDETTPADGYRLAGRALAELHGLDVALDPGSPKTLADHVAELVRPHPLELAEAFPEHRVLVEDTLAGLARDEAGWGAPGVAPLHRDYQLRQLFRDGARVWVVDWDLLATGDPAFDVAYFLVYLETHLPRRLVFDAQASFRNGYLEIGSGEVMSRVRTYRRFNLLRRSCRRFRLRDGGWQSRIREMLAEIAADGA